MSELLKDSDLTFWWAELILSKYVVRFTQKMRKSIKIASIANRCPYPFQPLDPSIHSCIVLMMYASSRTMVIFAY